MKKFFLWNLLVIVMISLLSVAFTACGPDPEPVVEIEQVLELYGLDAAFEKTDNTQQYAMELVITCNSGWEISGKPDWLNISNLKGHGNMTVKVWPNSVNNSVERKAILVVKSGSKEASKEVIQKGISSAYTHPKDIVTLTESTVWGYDFSNNLHHVYFTVEEELKLNGMTDADIQQSIQQSKLSEDKYEIYFDERNKIDWVRRTHEQFAQYGNYFSWYGLASNTKYMLISVAFDSNNEIGEIHRRSIATKINDRYNSPYIDVASIRVSLATLNGQYVYRIQSAKDSWYSTYASKFYSWAIVGTRVFDTLENTDAQIAYLLSQEIRKNPSPHDSYVNGTDRSEIRERIEGPVENADYTLPTNLLNDKYLQVIHWCTLANGDFSGRISKYWYDVQEESESSRKIVAHKKSNDKTPKLIQFDPEKLKKAYKVIRLN